MRGVASADRHLDWWRWLDAESRTAALWCVALNFPTHLQGEFRSNASIRRLHKMVARNPVRPGPIMTP
jgi:hypothetical protein